MERNLEVIGFFKTSFGAVVVIKLIDDNVFLDHGMILNNQGRSRWRITAVGMGKHPDLKNLKDDWALIRDYKIENVSGDDSLKEGDLLYLE